MNFEISSKASNEQNTASETEILSCDEDTSFELTESSANKVLDLDEKLKSSLEEAENLDKKIPGFSGLSKQYNRHKYSVAALKAIKTINEGKGCTYQAISSCIKYCFHLLDNFAIKNSIDWLLRKNIIRRNIQGKYLIRVKKRPVVKRRKNAAKKNNKNKKIKKSKKQKPKNRRNQKVL